MHQAYEAAGDAGRQVKNALHGVWLGHPLHPVLTDLPLGAWATALVFDTVESATGDRVCGRAADIAIGVGVAGAAAYLGGGLVYRERIGVTHADEGGPKEVTRALASSDLPDNAKRLGDAAGTPVMVARQHGSLCALAEHCSHLGGPLSEGTLKDGSIVCPWHGSEFALRDGRVINGPATHPQPCFDVRERAGAVEVRAPRSLP